MASFFEKLASSPHPPQLLVDDPNADNGERAIRAERQVLPALSYGYKTGGFQPMKL